MACRDKSTKYLEELGYNVVKHPRRGIRPLEILGRQNGAVTRLGTIQHLITHSTKPLPEILENETAANVNGQSSSDLMLGIGINLLGSIISAMGGNLGIHVSYTNARKISFTYTEVLGDRVQPLDVGKYLQDGDVDAGNLILKEYVIGRGDLFLITETIKSRKFSVNHHAKDGVELEVDVPALQAMVGAGVTVKSEGASSNVVTFEGSEYLVFGFKCLRVGVLDGVLSLLSTPAGATVLEAVTDTAPEHQILVQNGLLELTN